MFPTVVLFDIPRRIKGHHVGSEWDGELAKAGNFVTHPVTGGAWCDGLLGGRVFSRDASVYDVGSAYLLALVRCPFCRVVPLKFIFLL